MFLFQVVVITLDLYVYVPRSFQAGDQLEILRSPHSMDQLFPNRVDNLNGQTLRVTHAPEFPYYARKTLNPLKSPNYFYYQIVKEKLNATLWFDELPNDYAYTYKKEGTIRSDRFTLNELPVELYERGAMRFTYPFRVEKELIAIPRRPNTAVTMFTALWNETSWLFLFVLVITALLYRITIPVSKRQLSNQMLDILRIVVLGSPQIVIARDSSRILLVNVSLFCLVYISVIQSVITSQMVHPSTAPQIQTLEELDKEGYKLYRKHGYRDTKNKDFRQWSHMYDRRLFEDIPKLAVGISESEVKDLYALNDSFWHVVPDYEWEVYYAIYVPDKSPFLHFLTDLDFRVFEAGLRKYMKVRTVPGWNYIGKKANTLTRTLEDNAMAFYVLLWGYSAGAVLFAIEWGWKRYSDAKRVQRIITVQPALETLAELVEYDIEGDEEEIRDVYLDYE